MEKEFIPYEQALALKELGFDELCFMHYENNVLFQPFGNKDFYKNSELENDEVSAPLYQQTFRWFREKHNLESHVKKDWTDGVYHGYESMIECVDGIIDCGTYKTYEEAELECLKKLIEIVKNK